MSIFSGLGKVIEDAGHAVTSIADHTVLLKTFDLGGGASIKVYPVAYRVFLPRSVVDQMNVAEQYKNFAVQVADGFSVLGGEVAAVAQAVKVFIEVEWHAILLAANDDGVTLRGAYLPPSPVVVPTPGNS